MYRRLDHFSDSTLQKSVIQTLVITIVIEGLVCLLYSIQRQKPIPAILVTSILANIITQTLLWVTLSLFYQHYLTALLVAEILIWVLEGYLLWGVRFNQLKRGEVFFLSFMMNLISFGVGWFLPV